MERLPRRGYEGDASEFRHSVAPESELMLHPNLRTLSPLVLNGSISQLKKTRPVEWRRVFPDLTSFTPSRVSVAAVTFPTGPLLILVGEGVLPGTLRPVSPDTVGD